MIDEYASHRTPGLLFDVRLLPVGVSQYVAKPEHIRVVTIQAVNTLGARADDAVRSLVGEGFFVVEVLIAGQASLVEAQIRANARDALDEVDPGMRGVNGRPSGLPNFLGRLG